MARGASLAEPRAAGADLVRVAKIREHLLASRYKNRIETREDPFDIFGAVGRAAIVAGVKQIGTSA
ncbi:MAG: hypothetical protein C3F11_04275 [Methylocystaceae bacterium]|nr:MAG: hypothetical protein C3F11_04275 [Methylocystaceae bacterium]